MKFPEILNMIDIKEHQKVLSIPFLIKTGLEGSVNQQPPKELHKLLVEKSKEEAPMQD